MSTTREMQQERVETRDRVQAEQRSGDSGITVPELRQAGQITNRAERALDRVERVLSGGSSSFGDIIGLGADILGIVQETDRLLEGDGNPNQGSGSAQNNPQSDQTPDAESSSNPVSQAPQQPPTPGLQTSAPQATVETSAGNPSPAPSSNPRQQQPTQAPQQQAASTAPIIRDHKVLTSLPYIQSLGIEVTDKGQVFSQEANGQVVTIDGKQYVIVCTSFNAENSNVVALSVDQLNAESKGNGSKYLGLGEIPQSGNVSAEQLEKLKVYARTITNAHAASCDAYTISKLRGGSTQPQATEPAASAEVDPDSTRPPATANFTILEPIIVPPTDVNSVPSNPDLVRQLAATSGITFEGTPTDVAPLIEETGPFGLGIFGPEFLENSGSSSAPESTQQQQPTSPASEPANRINQPATSPAAPPSQPAPAQTAPVTAQQQITDQPRQIDPRISLNPDDELDSPA
jgi:hypothetical protein